MEATFQLNHTQKIYSNLWEFFRFRTPLHIEEESSSLARMSITPVHGRPTNSCSPSQL